MSFCYVMANAVIKTSIWGQQKNQVLILFSMNHIHKFWWNVKLQARLRLTKEDDTTTKDVMVKTVVMGSSIQQANNLGKQMLDPSFDDLTEYLLYQTSLE